MHRSMEVRALVEQIARLHTQEMMAELHDYSDAEILYGLSIFYGRQLHLKGYGWRYATGVVKKEAIVLRKEKEQLSPLPKLRN